MELPIIEDEFPKKVAILRHKTELEVYEIII